ncbi:MAG: DUF6010 family protein [Acidobacteriota bacterium]
MSDLFLGALLAAATILILRRLGPRFEHRLYALALIIAALIYVGFSLASDAPQWIGIEAGGVALYSTLAFLGWRLSPWFLAVGWAAHIPWDLLLHGGGSTPFVPTWYPTACLAYDLIVALYIATRARAWSMEVA